MGISMSGAIKPTGQTTTRANKAPTWSSSSNLGQTLGNKPFTANLLGSDPEGTTLKYGVYDGGVIPAGLSLNTDTGVLSGTPVNNPGVYTFPIYITDGVDVIPQTFTLEIQNATPVWTTVAGSLGTINEQASYSYSLVATDQNSDTLSFVVVSGALPSGLALASNGTISGTTGSVNQNTTSNFTVRLSDGTTGVSDRAFSLTVNNSINQPPVWSTTSGSIATINEQTSYSYSLAAADVDVGDNLTYAISTGALPGGLTLASNGTISGTTSAVYSNTTSTFIVGVSDGHNTAVYRSFSITVNNNINEPPVWTTAAGSLGSFTQNASINITLVATDPNSDTITYATTSSALPTGLTLSSAGVITGSTSQVGTFNFTITATDTHAGTTARAFSITLTVASQPFYALSTSTAYSSPDGVTWTAVGTMPATTPWYSICKNGNTLIAGKFSNNNSNNLAYSINGGTTWTATSSTVNNELMTIIWNGSVYVCAGINSYRTGVSTNGINWTMISPASINSKGAALIGNKVCLLGWLNSTTMTTTDGTTWVTNGSLPAGLGQRGAIASNGSIFCVAGYATGIAATSTDGINWTQRTMPLGNYTCMAWNSSVFCAMDYNNSYAATSPDGITWTQRTLPISGYWKSIAWNGAVFCAVQTSDNKAVTSPNGFTWTQQTMPEVTAWNTICV